MEKAKYIKILEARASNHHRPYENVLNDFMDFLLGYFSVDAYQGNGSHYKQHIRTCASTEPDFTALALMWLDDVARAMERGRWLDVFGELYEDMYLCRGKASKTGQFFTPASVSDLCAQMLQPGKDGVMVSDCAAGSGRLLLSHFIAAENYQANAGRRYRYIAQDSDPVACKMCALNMMVHGMAGVVKCADTLEDGTPSVVYHINEVRYPFPSPFYSVRTVKR